MFNLHFDPVTTQLVIGKKRKSDVGGVGGSAATMSALHIVNDLELQINIVIIKDFIEVADNGSFTVFQNGVVEIA